MKAVIEPLARYVSYFPEVNEAIKRRNKKLLDYDAQRSKVRKLIDKPSEDPQRLPRVRLFFFFLKKKMEGVLGLTEYNNRRNKRQIWPVNYMKI